MNGRNFDFKCSSKQFSWNVLSSLFFLCKTAAKRKVLVSFLWGGGGLYFLGFSMIFLSYSFTIILYILCEMFVVRCSSSSSSSFVDVEIYIADSIAFLKTEKWFLLSDKDSIRRIEYNWKVEKICQKLWYSLHLQGKTSSRNQSVIRISGRKSVCVQLLTGEKLKSWVLIDINPMEKSFPFLSRKRKD